MIFGLTADEVAKVRARATIPAPIIEQSRELSQALAAIASGVFSPDDRNRFAGLIDGIYNHDWFMVAADFDAYATGPARGRRDLDGSAELVFQDDPQHRAHGLVLLRPHDPAICRGNLESRMTTVPKDATPDALPPAGACRRNEIAAILAGTHTNPFAVLGVHPSGQGVRRPLLHSRRRRRSPP